MDTWVNSHVHTLDSCLSGPTAHRFSPFCFSFRIIALALRSSRLHWDLSSSRSPCWWAAWSPPWAHLLVAIPSFRTRGDYLAIISLAFMFIVKSLFENLEVVGGARGIERSAQVRQPRDRILLDDVLDLGNEQFRTLHARQGLECRP